MPMKNFITIFCSNLLVLFFSYLFIFTLASCKGPGDGLTETVPATVEITSRTITPTDSAFTPPRINRKCNKETSNECKSIFVDSNENQFIVAEGTVFVVTIKYGSGSEVISSAPQKLSQILIIPRDQYNTSIQYLKEWISNTALIVVDQMCKLKNNQELLEHIKNNYQSIGLVAQIYRDPDSDPPLSTITRPQSQPKRDAYLGYRAFASLTSDTPRPQPVKINLDAEESSAGAMLEEADVPPNRIQNTFPSYFPTLGESPVILSGLKQNSFLDELTLTDANGRNYVLYKKTEIDQAANHARDVFNFYEIAYLRSRFETLIADAKTKDLSLQPLGELCKDE